MNVERGNASVEVKAEIGIIGGSGLYSMPGFEAQEEAIIETPFGSPSDNFVLGTLAFVVLVIVIAVIVRHL